MADHENEEIIGNGREPSDGEPIPDESHYTPFIDHRHGTLMRTLCYMGSKFNVNSCVIPNE